MVFLSRIVVCISLVSVVACQPGTVVPGGSGGGEVGAAGGEGGGGTAAVDAGELDAGLIDAGPADGGDGGLADAGASDSGTDAGHDGGIDAGVDGGRTVGPSPDGGRFFGVNEHPQWLSYAAQDQLVDYLAQAGVQTVRIDMQWLLLEPSAKGQYDMNRVGRYDHFIAACKERDIEVLAILLDTPPWANGNKVSVATNSGRVVPPDDLGATAFDGGPGSPNYNDFVTYCLNRWGIHGTSPDGPKWVKAWEIWNEPDGYWAWSEAPGTSSPYGSGKSDPVKYAQLLKGAYRTIKAIDSTALVLGVSTSGTPLSTSLASPHMPADNRDWVRVLYDEGIKNSFDVFSAHVYNSVWNRAPEPIPAPPETVLARITTTLLPIMAAYGDAAKPLWVTETGYYTGGSNDAAQVTEAQQADFVTRAYAHAHGMPTVQRLYWYMFTGANTGTNLQNYFGLVRGSPYPNGLASPWPLKPGFDAYRQAPR